MNALRLSVGLLFISGTIFGLNLQQPLPGEELVLKSTENGGKDAKVRDLFDSNVGTAVVFIATKCPFSNAYNKRYNELASALKKKKVAFIPVNSNDTEAFAEVKEHAEAKDHKFSFPVYKDEGHKFADALGAERTPEAFLFDANKKLVYHGRVDDDSEGKNITRSDLAVAVDELTVNPKAPKISKAETKAFGCSIKRK